MPVPTYDHFIEPLLRYLATRPEGVSAAEAPPATTKSSMGAYKSLAPSLRLKRSSKV